MDILDELTLNIAKQSEQVDLVNDRVSGKDIKNLQIRMIKICKDICNHRKR